MESGWAQWALGGVMGVAMLFGGSILRSMQNRVLRVEDKSERIAVLEARYQSIDQRLERIEDKLDALNGRNP